MAHQIIMLGGRRAGKSSILSSILHSLEHETPGDLFTVKQKISYSSNDEADGVSCSLRDKRNEMDSLLRKRAKIGKNANFLVDMTASKAESIYSLELNIKGTSPVELDFIDVPGETMEDGKNDKTRAKLKDCDVFIIAIDTPYMMQDNECVNNVYNRVDEITGMMTEQSIYSNELDRKLIIFCPVKCEKWIREGKSNLVTERVCQTYRTLINTWVNHSSHFVDFLVMPIQTVGGLEHVKMLDGYRCFSSQSDKYGKLCSINEITDQLFLSDGTISDESCFDRVEEAKELNMNGVTIPLSWYKVNGQGFSPKNSEQPAFHILKFLVEKETRIVEEKKRNIDNSPFLLRLIRNWISPFGKYLEAYRNVIAQLDSTGKIKLGFDGFYKISNII